MRPSPIFLVLSILIGVSGVSASGCDSSEAGPGKSSSSSSSSGGSTSSSGGTSGATSSGGTSGGTSGATSSSGGNDGGVKGPLYGFVGSSDGRIRTYDVNDQTGAWTLKKENQVGQNPSFLAFDPARRRIVATDEVTGGLVRAFSFDPIAGTVTQTGMKSAGGAGSTHVSLDPTGKLVFVANYTGGNMSVIPIDDSGVLADASDTKASGPKSHWAGTNPSGTHVFVPTLDSDFVAQYTLQAGGKLADNGNAAVPANAGPRHLAFHPNEKWAYVINEVAITVTKFDFDKTTGKLTPGPTVRALPQNETISGRSGAEIFVHPGGKMLYASTRTYNSIAVFSIDQTTGEVTRTANVMTGNNRPRSFGMDPEGTFLFAGNQDANEVVGFKIDPTTGALTSLGKTITVTGPTYVGLARIP